MARQPSGLWLCLRRLCETMEDWAKERVFAAFGCPESADDRGGRAAGEGEVCADSPVSCLRHRRRTIGGRGGCGLLREVV
jgi:hypothetical protein